MLFPIIGFVSTGVEDTTDYSIKNKFKVVQKGSKVAILGLGGFFQLAKEVYEELKSKNNINATLINQIFASGWDKELLEELKKDHSLIVLLEDGSLEGWFGQRVAEIQMLRCCCMEQIRNLIIVCQWMYY